METTFATLNTRDYADGSFNCGDCGVCYSDTEYHVCQRCKLRVCAKCKSGHTSCELYEGEVG